MVGGGVGCWVGGGGGGGYTVLSVPQTLNGNCFYQINECGFKATLNQTFKFKPGLHIFMSFLLIST